MDRLTPQQEKFLSAYLDPKSSTWSNFYQSALKAGYSEEYSQNISGQMPTWLSENISDALLTEKALSNLKTALEGGMDLPDGAKNIQWKSTELSLKAMLNQKFGDKKSVDLTTGGDKFVMTPEVMAITQKYEDELNRLEDEDTTDKS